MAFSCSNFGLYNSTYFHGDGCTGINFSRGQSRKGGVEVRGFGFQSDPAAECSLFLKTTTFRASFSVERSAGGAFSKKTKGSSEIRSELQHPDEADSTDTRITIPQEGGDASLKKEACVLKSNYHPNLDFGNGGMDHPDGSGGNGKFPPGRRGGDGGRNDGDHEKNNGEDDEFGPILKFNEAIREAGVQSAFRHVRRCKNCRDPKSSSFEILGIAGLSLASRFCNEVLLTPSEPNACRSILPI